MIDWDTQLLRSLLFVPGSDRHKLAKVDSFGADAIVIDLEDAVADEEKTAARATTAEALPTYEEGTVVVVRVNGRPTGRMVDDITQRRPAQASTRSWSRRSRTRRRSRRPMACWPGPSGTRGCPSAGSACWR